MEVLVTHTAGCDCPCSLAFGATLPLERQSLPAPFLFFIAVSLATITAASVAKGSHDTCEEIQTFRGIQDVRALPGKLFFYPISPFAFRGTVSHYKVTLANGSALPKWLEFNHDTNTLQGLPVLQERGEYRLTVTAHGGACGHHTPAATADFALRVHNHVTVWEEQRSTNPNPMNDIICSVELCARGFSVTFAEIIIQQHTAGSLAIQERLSLIYTVAEYLRLDPSFLTLTPLAASLNKRLWDQTVLGEDVKYIGAPGNHYVGLLWPVQFGAFAFLYELGEVLRRNVQSSHLSQLLGYEIVGWRIHQKGGREKKHLGKRSRRQLMPTPRPTLRPNQIGMQQTTTNTFWSTTRRHTGSAVGPSASSSFLYEAGRTIVPTDTDLSFHSVTLQRDPRTSHVLSVLTSPSASTTFPSLSSAVPELSPSLTTAASTEFARRDCLCSRTPPISEFSPQTQALQQEMHPSLKDSEPTPHFTERYLSLSVPASKTQALGSRPVWPTAGASVSPEDTSSEKTPPADSPEEFVRTTLAPSSPYAHLTTSGWASEDPFLATDLSGLSTMSSLAKAQFSFSSVATSLFLLSDSHQNQDLLSDGKHVSESFVSSPRTKEHLFTEENALPGTAFQTETPGWGMDLTRTDVSSALDSATTGGPSAHKTGLAPDPSPAPQFRYSDRYSDHTPALTMHSTQGFSMSLFFASVEFGLIDRISRVPTELPSRPLATTPKELADSSRFFNAVEELFFEDSRTSPQVFKTDERSSRPFTTVAQIHGLFLMTDQASALSTPHAEAPFGNEPSQFIPVTASSIVIPSALLLSEESLSQEPSQKRLWSSYPTLLLSLPLEFASTPKLLHSTHDMTADATGGVRSPAAHLAVLQLEASDFVLASPLETEAAFHITRKCPAQQLEDPAVTSLQAGLHAVSLSPGGPGTVQAASCLPSRPSTSVFPPTPSEELSFGTGAIWTPGLPPSQIVPTGQTNTSPRVVNVIQWITATIGCKFSFSVPAETFYDREDGDTPQLTLGMKLADGSPLGPENWLCFNPRFQTMHGYPLANDFQYSPQEFLLFATDSEGLKTSDTLTIELHTAATMPCHTYTVRTKNSYHSFLRERKRVYLFFEKLSKYLSSSSTGNMALLHLRPGSTLITWYDESFCTRNDGCARDEIQGVLVKLRLQGGTVHPDFVKAMLPEYKIYETEDVAYGGTCFSNESSTSNPTIAAFKDHQCWTKNLFLALVTALCATIMIILMITFCYCKHHKEVIGSQAPSFHGRPFFSYADLEIDRLKSRKAPILEREVPPPAELWLPVPTASQQHLYRLRPNLATSTLPPAPKYRLPPLYGRDEPGQTCDSCNHTKPYPKARIC